MGVIKAEGRRYWGNSQLDGWLYWVVVHTKDVKNMSDDDIIFDLGMEYNYQGPGRYFQHKGYVKRGRNRTLIKMHAGYDV